MGARTKYLCLAGILIIAAFLRFYHLTAVPPGLYPDEAVNGNDAAVAAATGRYQVFYPANNGREGLYMNLVGLEFQFFGAPHEPWAVRLPAAVAGVLTVLGLYLLVTELLDNGAGLLASFLLATSFWSINFSRIGFRAILAPLFLVWAIWLFLRAVRGARPRAALWCAAIAGVVYALGFYTYIAYRVTPLLFLVFIPFFARGENRAPHFWKRALFFMVATFIVAAPIGWYFLHNPADFLGRTSEISVAAAANPIVQFAVNTGKELLMFNWRGDTNWRQNISGAPELFWPVGILFLVGIAIGILSLARRRRGGPAADNRTERSVFFSAFPVVLTFAWFLLALLPAALSNEAIPHALRSILMLPPAMILAAVGGVWAYRVMRAGSRRGAFAAAVLFTVAVAAAGYADYFIVWAQNPNVPGAFAADYVAIGREINALPSSTPKYVVVDAGGVLVNGIPMPAQTTMFITDTFTAADQEAQNIHYLLPDQINLIPGDAPSGTIFHIR